MLNSKDKIQYKILQKSIQSTSLLVIKGFIDVISINGSIFPAIKDVIFLEISQLKNGIYDTKNGTFMKLSTFELKQMKYAAKEIYQKEKSSFIKTNSTNARIDLPKKTCSFNYDKNRYWLNIDNIGISFDKYELLSFIDEIDNIYLEMNKYLFMYQRKYEKVMKDISNKNNS